MAARSKVRIIPLTLENKAGWLRLCLLTFAIVVLRYGSGLAVQSPEVVRSTITHAIGIPAGPGQCLVSVGGKVQEGGAITLHIAPDCSIVPVRAEPPSQPGRPPLQSIEATAKLPQLREPTIVPTIEGTALFLSRAMRHSLEENAPDFRTWWPRHYLSSVIWNYKFSSISAPFAVLGDFNKDGVVDAALHGHDRKSDLVIVLLSKVEVFDVTALERSAAFDMPVGPRDDTGLGEEPFGLSKFLTYFPPGKLSSSREKGQLVLDRDAFRVSQLGQASKVYYFSKGNFLSYSLADQPVP